MARGTNKTGMRKGPTELQECVCNCCGATAMAVPGGKHRKCGQRNPVTQKTYELFDRHGPFQPKQFKSIILGGGPKGRWEAA